MTHSDFRWFGAKINICYMINANELRIGNWVSNGQKRFSVDPNVIYDLHNYEGYSLDPIPITPEILEKAGFKTESHFANFVIYKLNGINFSIAENNDKTYWYYNYCDEDDYYSRYWPELKHLHQLQNFYFAWTGKELAINL